MTRLGLRECLAALGLALCLGFAASAPAAAQEFELAGAPSPVSGRDEIELTVNRDGTAQEIRTRRIKALTEAAATGIAKQVVAYQSTLQTLTIVEAYTLKVDGRRLNVDRAGIITQDVAANDVDAHDSKTRSILFPDVAVGDTIVLVVRKETKKPILAGHFNTLFGAENYVTDIVRVIAPKDLWLNVKSFGENYEHNVVFEEDKVTHTLIHQAMPKTPGRGNENGAIAPVENEIPHIVVTTFKDYWMLGRAAWAASKSRVESTPEITALADEITKGITDRRKQAEAIDNWIKRNIRYVAIEIGAGGIIPHYATAILKNRYGDCKDHATLMASLLAAKGIDSDLVLVRVGNAFALPEAAITGAFNHMMLYIPEFQLYVDPTAHPAGFGVLMTNAYDQPVVRMSAKGVWVARIPAMRANDHVSLNRTRIFIAADGTVTGETAETTSGIFAMRARTRAGEVRDTTGVDDGAEAELSANGNPGLGLFDLEETTSLAEPFTVNGKFALGKVKLSAKTQLGVPVGLALLSRPGTVLLGSRVNGRRLPFVCMSGRQIEEIELNFAPGLPLPKPMAAQKVNGPVFGFISSMKLEGRKLTVRREFVAQVPGQICAPHLETQIAKAMQDVNGSLRTQLAFDDTSPMMEQLRQMDRQAANQRGRVN